MTTLARWAGVALCVACVTLPRAAGAAAPPGVNVEARPAGELDAIHSIEPVLTDRLSKSDTVERRLRNGFTNNLVVITQAFAAAHTDDDPLAVAVTNIRVKYLPDEDRFVVDVEDHAGQRIVRARTYAAVIATCAAVRVPLGAAERFATGGPYVLRVQVELNPVTDETRERAWQHVSNPRASTDAARGGFLGGIVRFFLNSKVPDYDKRWEYWSKPFVPTPLEAQPAAVRLAPRVAPVAVPAAPAGAAGGSGAGSDGTLGGER